ncbi:MAG: hypothetical protein ACOC8D_01875 [bacterium]
MTGSGRRNPGLLLGVAAVLTGAALALVFASRLPLGVDDWAWPRVRQPAWGAALYPLLLYVLIVGIAVAAWTRAPRAGRAETGAAVATLTVLAFLAQVAVGQQSPAGYQESVMAVALPGPNRYHQAARRIERLGPVLRRYPSWMRDARHPLMITNPGGPLTFLWCMNQVFAGDEAGAARFVRWCERNLAMGLRLRETPYGGRLLASMSEAELAGAWLVTFVLRGVAALVVAGTYALARELYDRRTAVAAAAFGAAIPSLLLFSPGLDQAYPALAVTALWLAWGAGRRRSAWRAAVAGLAVSAGMFFTLAFAVVGLWCGLLGLAGLARREERASRVEAAWLLAVGAVGWVVPILLLYTGLGYNSLGAWWGAWRTNARFNLAQGRTWWKWVLVNPVEFTAFLGLPVACLFLRRVVGEARAALAERGSGVDWPVLILAGLLLVLSVAGINRGEVARLWQFLMPACAVAAAAEVGRYAPYRRTVLTVTLVLQCVQVVAFKAGLDVLVGPYRLLGG